MDYSDPRSRYRTDPHFSALVDQIRMWIRRLDYTPSEVREAGMLAAVLEEMERPMESFVYVGKIEAMLDEAHASRTKKAGKQEPYRGPSGRIMIHDDDCGGVIGRDGLCGKCGISPDMQSLGYVDEKGKEAP